MVFKKIARNLFGIWALIVFLVSLIVAFICYVPIFLIVDKKKAPFIAHKYVSRNWAKFLFIMFGVRLKIVNRDFLDDNQVYVFISNHRSQLDIPAYAISAKHTIRFLAKAELTKIPLLGFIIKKLYIPVNRGDKEARARSMQNMMQSLRDGVSVFICPEGTRNKTIEHLLPFRDGAFRLAIQSQLPIAILVIKNSDKLLSPLHPIALSPGKIVCEWCKPIPTVGMIENDIERLKELTVKQMVTVLDNA